MTLIPPSSHGAPPGPGGGPGAPYQPASGDDVTLLTDSTGAHVLIAGGDDSGGAYLQSIDGTQKLSANNGGAFATGSFSAATIPQLSPAGVTTSGALLTQQFVSGTAAPVASSDVEVHTPVTFNPGVATTATCKVELSPDNVTFSTLAIWTVPVGVALDGTIQDVAVRVPAGWSLKLTVNAQAVLGLSTYY